VNFSADSGSTSLTWLRAMGKKKGSKGRGGLGFLSFYNFL